MMSVHEAVRYVRAQPGYSELVRDAYLGEDLFEAAERFRVSAEFSEVSRRIGTEVNDAVILDLGAGTGMASLAFSNSGAKLVYALEPDPSHEIGRGAIARLAARMPIEILDASGESIPLPDSTVDIVYARQVLHHTRDLRLVLRECARVLRDGGTFFACREHVAEDSLDLSVFLKRHPLHKLTGQENAFPLTAYLNAIRSAGLEMTDILGPWDSVINAFPAVRSAAELDQYPRALLTHRFGALGTIVGSFPGVTALIWRRLKRPTPGEMYSFVAVKPWVGPSAR